ncbi:hypothetical protein BBBOND_0303190 [Babesia bigemina]|uniref:Uncharacterized protein n=1 Tax=Babesia bigemina TaxID=5866 RepID=A0A061DDN5_BABBI|nr:hypothetical protein BBBOND_0303190 [Babesia bigemina]CDR96415.1 hypothetical protein BBBOND_0303190 [Babesia bigemina]|eukprot:XP_012768601.1 hypothetical protein BBBOND_0303190 [Babesia bigemina]
MWRRCLESLRPRLKAHFTNENRSKVALLGGCCACVYLNGTWLYMRNRSGESAECNRLDGPIPQVKNRLFISDFISHFSPYLLPTFSRGGWMSEFEKIVDTGSSEFRERLMAYLCLNKVLRNAVCVRSLFSGSKKFDLVMSDIVNPKDLPSSANKADDSDKKEPELLFNVKMSCLEQYLRAIPKEERKVEYEDLAHLIKLPKLYPSAGANEKVSRVLRLFFENEDNCVMVAKKEFEAFESCSLINNNENKASDMVLTYLYSTKSTKSWFSALLSDTHLTAVNNAESIDMINKAVRSQEMALSPLAVSRVNFDGLLPVLSAVEISYAFAFLRTIFSGKVPGVDRGSKFQMALMEGCKTTRGILIFHGIFLIQSKLINSEYYFKNEDYMIPMSLAMCSSSWLALSALAMTHRHLLFPLMVHRFFN